MAQLSADFGLGDLDLHVMNMADTIAEAFRRAIADGFDPSDLYLVGVDTDGQYVNVTIGVANIRDLTYEVDSTLHLS